MATRIIGRIIRTICYNRYR